MALASGHEGAGVARFLPGPGAPSTVNASEHLGEALAACGRQVGQAALPEVTQRRLDEQRPLRALAAMPAARELPTGRVRDHRIGLAIEVGLNR